MEACLQRRSSELRHSSPQGTNDKVFYMFLFFIPIIRNFEKMNKIYKKITKLLHISEKSSNFVADLINRYLT